jgi:hypothetical protein
LSIGCRRIGGGVNLRLGGEFGLVIDAPASHGPSGEAHAPQGTIVSALQLASGPTLAIWYREVLSPDLHLGPEQKGRYPNEFSKEPEVSGGGQRAHMDGYTITGFKWTKDPAPPSGGHAALYLWYRQVPSSAAIAQRRQHGR